MQAMFNNVLIPMSAFAHSDYMINSCLNRLVVSIRYWNACPKRCWFSENYTTSSNNMSNIAHMSGSIVLTGYRSTAHELMVASWGRIMSPQLPAWDWRSPSICIPVEVLFARQILCVWPQNEMDVFDVDGDAFSEKTEQAHLESVGKIC